MGSYNSSVAEFKKCMMNSFEMSNLGLLHYCLGLEVKQGSDEIFISQKKYAMDLLKKSNMINCKVAVTPMNVNEKLKLKDGTSLINVIHYRSLVGGLIYLTHTRLYIAFSIGVVSRFIHSSSKHHLGAIKRIICYIAETTNYGIWYSHNFNCKLFDFTNSDYAGALND